MRHVPVLLEEVIESLQLAPVMNVIDCTLGDGGHAEEILKKTAPDGKLLGIDADLESLLRAKQFLQRFGERVAFIQDNFVNVKAIVERERFGPVHGILMDLGWSRPQFEERKRGFSFLKDEPLDMRYGGGQSKTAGMLVNELPKEELEQIFHEYGEEKLSKEIVTAIVKKRQQASIDRTKELADIILEAYRKKLQTAKEIPWVGGLHPATKVFQALRMAVNDELNVLEKALAQAGDVLAPGGRLAVITFHSLEDRIVKHRFREMEKVGFAGVAKKPIICSERERLANPSARSAKLRVIEKL